MSHKYFTLLSVILSCLTISSCGSEVKEMEAPAESKTLNLSDYGLSASIDLVDSKIELVTIQPKYEQKLLKNKKLELFTEDDFMIVISECQENGVEMKVEFAEGFGETVVEQGENFCVIQQEDEDGNPVYDVSFFVEKENAFIELKVCDPNTKAQLSDLEIAKKGLKKARSFKFI